MSLSNVGSKTYLRDTFIHMRCIKPFLIIYIGKISKICQKQYLVTKRVNQII